MDNKKQINISFSLDELYELLTTVNYYRSINGEKIIYGQNNELGRDYAGYNLDRKLNNIIVGEENKEIDNA